MPRNKDDGRGRLGGRQPGTPNKDKPLKTFLRQHSQNYFETNITVDEKFISDFITSAAVKSGIKLDDAEKYRDILCPFRVGDIISQFDADCQSLSAEDRVKNEIALLKFHTPQMQSTSVDMTISDEKQTLTERLARLASEEAD
ncbi:MAG: hypothetical protein HUK06_09975 [Bacteroidaceae bacterium]|nr:hypothetical protein [Bacteroidaceae bacterium]